RGLLGIAVDPGWPARPYVYVHCTDGRSGNHVAVSRFTLTGDLAGSGNGLLTFDPATRYDLRADFPDNASNHNGGTARFGPDGKLYVSLGDDATGCPAQDITRAVGKILRFDVSRLPSSGSGPAPYALIAPADNPFATNADSIARLVYVEGLRNPFRFSIDAPTGALVIGDVGENTWEEVDLAATGGMDMGWPVYEGPDPYMSCLGTPPAPYTAPIAYYPHPTGNAIIGGPRYRVPAIGSQHFPPEYEGDIFFLDYYSGLMRRIKLTGGTWAPASAPGQPTATEWANGMDGVSDCIELSDGTLAYCRQGSTGSATGELRSIGFSGAVSTPPPGLEPLALAAPRPNPSDGRTTI
ncbi:MAG TPA: PQQ-dependent sugar dehydrogenase, partial [Dongiaceae bacterium]|nr:PQQ-dependent sugar dehydrogenase [Dongiaceae bacterium]